MFSESHVFVGRLGAEPELRTTDQGVSVVNFSVALDRSYKNSNGQRVDRTQWIRVTAWRGAAETLAQYLQKGSRFLFTAEEVTVSAYTDNDGNPRASLEATIGINDSFTFLDSPNNNGNGASANGVSANGTTVHTQTAAQVDDVPF